MKKIAITIITSVFLFYFSVEAEDAVEKIIKEKCLTTPIVIQKILEERKLVAVYAQEFNDIIISGNKPNERYLIVCYADKELAEKFWGNGGIVPMYPENIKAKICFDVKKKIIKFYWHDEWGSIHFIAYAPL